MINRTLIVVLVGLLCVHLAFAQTPPHEERERGIRLYNEGKTAEAVSALQAATARDKKDEEAWHYLGLAQVRADDMKAARKAFSSAIALRNDFAPAHTGLA
jgi:Flp pilus assembly protein TadD